MGKHSFPPRLTKLECDVLDSYNQSEFLLHWSTTTAKLERRGLLEENRDEGSYRLTNRGELMIRRYRKQQADIAFKREAATA